MIATGGRYSIDDRMVAEEALALVDELRDSIGVGMVYDRNLEPITRPELEMARADD